MNVDEVTRVIQSETIPVTGEGYDVMLDVIFPKGLTDELSLLLSVNYEQRWHTTESFT